MDVRLPDGTIIKNVPEGTTRAQLVQKLQGNGMAVPSEWLQEAPAPKPASVQAGETIKDSLPRQIGLTARYGLEGLAGFAEIGTEPIRYLAQKAGFLKGARPLQAEVSARLDAIGLPSPQTSDERVIGDATRMGFGAMGGAGVLNQAANKTGGLVKEALTSMAARPGVATVSAAGSGGAGGSVREAGGSPTQQFAASLLGGIAAPLAVSGVQNAGNSLTNAVKSLRVTPQELDARLSVELSRSGVNWADLGASVKMQLREDAKKAIVSGQPLDAAALRRLADYRNIGATPLLGDITQDPAILTQQRNLSKQIANTSGFTGANLPNIDNANARRVINTLESASKSTDDAFTTGQRIIGSVQGRDAAMKAQERTLYKTAEEQLGRNIQLDRGAFLNEAYGNLAKSNRMAFLPGEIGDFLDQLGKGFVEKGGQKFTVPFDADAIDNLKTMLSTASRGAKDGNTKAAVSQVYNALESVQPRVPAFGGNQVATGAQAAAMRAGDPAAKSMEAWDTARSFARDRRQWQESAKFIEDAIGGASPDSFVKTHVIGADVGELSKLRAAFDKSPDVLESVRKQLVQHILDRGRADGDTVKFSSAGMNDALKAIGDRKLSLFFSPDEIQQLRSAVNVGRYMQSQPIGSAVNNSNTAGALLGRLSGILDKASPIPMVGPLAAQPLQGGLLQLQIRGMNNLSKGLLNTAEMPPQPLAPSLMLPGLLATTPLLNQ